MKNEFLDAYEILFNDSYNRLYKILKIKLDANRKCQTILDEKIKSRMRLKLQNMMNNKTQLIFGIVTKHTFKSATFTNTNSCD